MKIKGKKDLTAERLRGREAIDAVMLPRINEAMGPKFALYQLKTMLAQQNYKMSETDDPEDIMTRFTATTQAVAAIERERQAAQSRIDNATSAAEIDAIIASL